MLNLGLTGTIHLAVEPVDGRKGIDGLAGVARGALGHDPASGDLFVFRNRRGGSLKILAWMGDGFALYLRRLEQGTFAFPITQPVSTTELTITPTQLAMILGGIEPASTRTRKRFQKPTHVPESL
jgi:transposase